MIAIFNNEAADYDSWYTTKMGKHVDWVETQCAFGLLQGRKGQKILDLGCGTGNFSIKLAKQDYSVTGIDISTEMLRIARKKSNQEALNINFRRMDACNLDFADQSFDGAISMAAFEFIKDPARAMDEMFRVVKVGGFVLLGTINKDSKWGEFYRSEKIRQNSVYHYANFKTIDDLKELKSESLQTISSCLFLPPDTKPEDINPENELKMAEFERGGFICALWIK